ncbi:Hypothetical predicted protein [Lecanosticta acicola]|uniref:Uncharacterized protein n=1 Tax=Lecanosticta acicola TaxID=111012 RepID=A0AAI9E9B6_9PEZI|nr:Hypothetical predicted protein [Lecanosticta acicola]
MVKGAARRRVIVEDSDDDFGDAVLLPNPPKMRARKSAPAFSPRMRARKSAPAGPPKMRARKSAPAGPPQMRPRKSAPASPPKMRARKSASAFPPPSVTSRVVSYTSSKLEKQDGSGKAVLPKAPATRPKQHAAHEAQMSISSLSPHIPSRYHTKTQRRITFFSLEEEDRVAVYEHHLIVDGAGIQLAVQAPFTREPALLAASKQVRREALPIWYKENTFHSRFIYDIIAWLDRLDSARLSMLQWVNLDEPLPAGFVLPGLRKLNKRVKDGLKRNAVAVPVVVEQERETDWSGSHATVHDKDSCKREMVTMDDIGQYNDLDGMWETLQRSGVGKRILTNVTRKKRRSKGARDGSDEYMESDEDGEDGTCGNEEMGGM